MSDQDPKATASTDAGRLAIAVGIYEAMETYGPIEVRPRTVSKIQIALEKAFVEGQRHFRGLYEQQWPPIPGGPIETKHIPAEKVPSGTHTFKGVPLGAPSAGRNIRPMQAGTLSETRNLSDILGDAIKAAAPDPHEKALDRVVDSRQWRCRKCGHYEVVGSTPPKGWRCPLCAGDVEEGDGKP